MSRLETNDSTASTNVTSEDTSLLHPDLPIESQEEDKLDRAGFALEIAKAIQGWKGPDGLAFALYGAWGEGKSSVKNMVVEELKKAPKHSGSKKHLQGDKVHAGKTFQF